MDGQPFFWKSVFRVKAVWNCLATTAFFFGDDLARDFFKAPHPDPIFRACFLSLAFIFGLGYWWAGGNPERNRDLLRMGVLGQFSVFAILAYGVTLARNAWPWPFVLPGIIDLIFAIAFAVYLITNDPPSQNLTPPA